MKQKSQNVAEPVDPRVEKTRAAIAAAFAGLLMRRSYDRIRVSDITRKARVGRATFYAHFATKHVLLQTELQRIVSRAILDAPGEASLVDCTRLFDHTQRARDIFRSLTAGSARAVTERYLQDAIETRITGALMLRGETPARTRSFVPRFVASTLLTLIAWSLEQTDAPTPEELQSSFRSLVGRALGSPKI